MIKEGGTTLRAGELRESITIKEPVVIKDSYGGNVTEWRDVISTRDKVKQDSGSRENQNNEILHTAIVSFTIRLYHRLNESMIIIWNGRKYRILSIINELYKKSITIKTELINE